MPLYEHQVTLVANTMTTVVVPVPANEISFTIESGAAEVYGSTDGSTPTVGGDNEFTIPAVVGEVVTVMVPQPTQAETPGPANVTVKLISSGTPVVNITV